MGNNQVPFEESRKHLKELSDDQLKERFWNLAEEIVEPLLELGKKYTSPSVERSVLMRMGFSSLETTKIVNQVLTLGLMSKGAGHVVYRLAKENTLTIREAGLQFAEGKYADQALAIFKRGNK